MASPTPFLKAHVVGSMLRPRGRAKQAAKLRLVDQIAQEVLHV